MKVSVIQLIALCGVAAFAAQPVMAQQVTTCDVECVGPYNACSWEALNSPDQNAALKACENAQFVCVKYCIAKNGEVPYVYKPSPHPEAVETSNPTSTKAPKTSNLRV